MTTTDKIIEAIRECAGQEIGYKDDRIELNKIYLSDLRKAIQSVLEAQPDVNLETVKHLEALKDIFLKELTYPMSMGIKSKGCNDC